VGLKPISCELTLPLIRAAEEQQTEWQWSVSTLLQCYSYR
jgi:hypothetical protein